MDNYFPSIGTKENFPSQRTGKIFKAGIVSPFGGKSVSSIPSAKETILFQKPNSITVNRDHRSCISSYGSNVQVSISDIFSKDDSLSRNQPDFSRLFSSKTRNKSNKKKKKEIHLRFNYSSIDSAKYYPGPGDYAPKNIINSSEGQNNFRYKQLFNYGRENIPLFQDNDNQVGPGTYDVKMNRGTIGAYISKNERFKSKKLSFFEKNVGPGLYNISRDLVSKNKGHPSYMFVKSEKNIKLADQLLNEINQSAIHQSEKMMLEKKINQYRNSNNKNSKSYRIKSFDQIKSEILKNEAKEKRIEVKKEEDKEESKEKYSKGYIKLMKEYGNPQYLLNPKENDSKMNKYNHVMNSKTPRFGGDFLGVNKGIPGPCYYQTPKFENHKNFNSNCNNKWL